MTTFTREQCVYLEKYPDIVDALLRSLLEAQAFIASPANKLTDDLGEDNEIRSQPAGGVRYQFHVMPSGRRKEYRCAPGDADIDLPGGQGSHLDGTATYVNYFRVETDHIWRKSPVPEQPREAPSCC